MMQTVDREQDDDAARALFGLTDDAVCLIERQRGEADGSRDYRYLAVNPAMRALLGVPDPTGRSVRDSFPEDAEAWHDDCDRVLVTGACMRIERRLGAKGMLLQITVARAEDGTGRRLLVVMRDVTARRPGEEAFHDDEARFRAFVTASADVVYRMSPDWSEMRQLQGKSFLRDTGEPASDWLDRYIHPDDQAMVRAAVDEAIRAKAVFALEHRVLQADGTLGWTQSRAVPILDDRGEIREWLGAATDVTAAKALDLARATAEAVSRQASGRYLTLFNAIDQGFCTIEVAFDADDHPLDYRFVEVSPSFERQTGIANAAGRWMREIAPDQDQRWFDIYGRVALTGESARFEDFSTPLDRWWDVFAFRIDDPALHRIGVLFRDISDRKRAEAALRASEARLAAAFESVPVGMAVIDMAGKAIVANAEYRRFLPGGIIPSRDPARGGRWRAWDRDGAPIAPTDYPGARAMRGESIFPGLEMLYTDDAGRDIWTSVATAPTRDERGQVTGAVSVISDIDFAKRNAEALSASEERQAFLLRLSDALRPLDDPGAIADTACRLIVGQIGGSQAHYADLTGDAGEEMGEVRGEHVAIGATFPRRFPLAPFGEPILRLLRAGRSLVLRDADEDERLNAAQRAAFHAVKAPTVISVPLVKNGRWLAALTLHDIASRDWTVSDVALIEEVAERTWAAVERARAEIALRDGEERFAQFAASSSDGLWIRDAATLRMEYTSPAIATIYGVAPRALIGDPDRWTKHVLVEDREAALAHLASARDGMPVVHEFRIRRPADGSVRWIRNTDFPLRDGQDRIQRIGGITEDVTEARQLAERQVVLLAEVQHRVRNILAVVRSVFSRTVEAGGDVADIADHFTGRLDSLARTQVVVTRSATGLVDLENLIRDELLSVGVGDGPNVTIAGPDVALPPVAAESIGLAVHELTTNALKYGALKTPGAQLLINWTVNLDYGGTRQLNLTWIEQGVPAIDVKPGHKGFGSELIEEALPYRLGAETSLHFMGGGVHCTITVPLPAETSMPTA